MSHRYTDTEINFIEKKCKGKTSYELTKEFNEYFSMNLKRSQVRACMKNHQFTSDIDHKLLKQFHTSKFTTEQTEFIKQNIKGRRTKELTKIFNDYFNLDFNSNSLRSFIKRNSFKSGLDCQFKKGEIPPNKGIKGIHYKGSEKTWFKKGNMPANYSPVGSEILTQDNYIKIKVADPNVWRFKHHIIWEKHNGNIPEGCAVMFGDTNSQNLDINNLILVTNQQLLNMNRYKLIQSNADLTRTGVIIADLHQKISDIKKKSK